MTNLNKMEGVPISEEEVAKKLGFSSVTEFRRWNTDLSRKVQDLEYELYKAKNEIERFQWVGQRYDKMLEITHNRLEEIGQNEELCLAIRIVRGKEPDWNRILRKYLNE